jgi:GNAT superfamily N-acetyltransferase
MYLAVAAVAFSPERTASREPPADAHPDTITGTHIASNAMRLTTDLLFPIRASYGAKVIPQLPGMVGRSEFRIRAGSHDDIEWVVRRHREIYSDEYGWDSRFGDLVAGIASDFVRDLDPLKERCWIAERRGERIGCVFLVRNKDETAQLRLLLVEPSARGLGVGARLVRKCIDFARASGYERLRLWTNDVLHSARRIYEAAGFRLVEEEQHDSWGKPLTSQTWELDLAAPSN